MNVNTKQKEEKKESSLRDMIMRNMDMFKMAVPKTVTPERMARIAMTAVTKIRSSVFVALLLFSVRCLPPHSLGLK